MWIHISGEFIYIIKLLIWIIFCLTEIIDEGKKKEKYTVKTYGRKSHISIYIYSVTYLAYILFH